MNRVENLKNRIQQLDIKSNLMQHESGVSAPRVMEIRNLRCMLSGTFDFIQMYGTSELIEIESMENEIEEVRDRLQDLEEDPMYAGKHQFLIDNVESNDTKES